MYGQGSKIALVRSYLRVPQTVGQVNILIFLVKINFSPYMPIVFVMQGKCNFKIFRALMDIRQYWKTQKEVIPTKKGLYLRPLEYIAVKELLTEIGRALLKLDGVVPCYMQSDHMNQLGALRCLECNQNDYQNW